LLEPVPVDISSLDNAYMALSLLSLVTPYQNPKDVLVREPGQRRYGPARRAPDLAMESWEYAMLSAQVYKNDWVKRMATMAEADVSDARDWQAWIDNHWDRWTEIPSDDLRKDAKRKGLYFDVYESRSTSEPKRIVVAFRGTEFTSWKDWLTNIRWLRFTRFLPGYQDQYTVVAKDLVVEFARQVIARGLNRDDVKIITTGHSLGGGLAQQFAYALNAPDDTEATIQPVSYVYAFHPSPVTGWFSVPKEIRDRNAKDLRIDRIFEHGEILAYLRLLLSQFYPPSATAPAIREIRFSFLDSNSTIKNHGIEAFAKFLAKSAQPVQA
jgi:hypothetical protein